MRSLTHGGVNDDYYYIGTNIPIYETRKETFEQLLPYLDGLAYVAKRYFEIKEESEEKIELLQKYLLHEWRL